MSYWWVNQNQTYRHEIRGGYMWSPKINANGARNTFYDNMSRVQSGDIIFSYADTFIKAIGIATNAAESAPKPTSFGVAGSYWNDEGWYVEVEYRELSNSIRPREHMHLLEQTLPERYSPIRRDGGGNQGVYLASLPQMMAVRLLSILGSEAEDYLRELELVGARYSQDLALEAQIAQRRDIPATEIQQLVKARRGQGLFKSRVELVERGCRITGVTNAPHLIASHIKPWRVASDSEKLDGFNGLLLAPHIDHLFDRNYISFSDDGRLRISQRLSPSVLSKWSIDPRINVGTFTREQSRYLEFHRDVLFSLQECSR